MADCTSSKIEHLKLPKGPELNILLTGITGHGKSATGNSIILKKKHFMTKSGLDSLTKDYFPGCNEIDDRPIFVADTPGWRDTAQVDDESQQKLVINALTKSLTSCSEGYDAILLVVSSSSRMAHSDKEAIEMWIEIIGENEFKTHGVLVLTFADQMDFENGYDLKETKRQWWEVQALKNHFLLEACSNRCVIFSNRTNDLQMQRQQLYDLVTCIDEMKNKGRCIPILCQSPNGADKANFDYAVQISKFIKHFSLLKTKIESIKTESGAKRERIIERREKDLEYLKKQLMQKKNKSIYDGIYANVRELGNDFCAIRHLAGVPKNEGMIINNMCKRIDNILSGLQEILEKTLYWKSVRNKIVVFFRDILPMAVASTALSAGFGILATNVAAPVGLALVASGGVVGVAGAINIIARIMGKKDGEKRDK